ncbi:MAG: DNA repair protein RecN [Pseudonocardiales bacterium]|nr:MAG: DNA repair protein RecN [Pseudonocardiales bacterium]
MLEELRIRGLGVIADATLELCPGLTVVTGETGAGKTMVVAGLGLLFGGRADTGRVRAGERQAFVDGRLRLPDDSPALARAVEAGAERDDDGTLLAGRTVSAEGRSRAHLGGRSVPVSVLGVLGEDLVTVHGQADQLRLLRPAEQRAALDRFGGAAVADLLARHRPTFDSWQAVVADLADRASQARQRSQEADLLRHGLAEIAAVDPQPGEDDTLRAESQRLEHADALRRAATGAAAALVADPASDEADATGLLGVAHRALDAVAGHDPALADLTKRVGELGYLAADAATELASYADSLDADPGRLAQLNDRRAALAGLLRKYADTVDGVISWAGEAALRLDQLDSSTDRLAALAAERDALTERLAETAAALSAARCEAADRFAAAVTAELADLALPHAQVQVEVRNRPAVTGAASLLIGGQPVSVGPDGVDEVDLLLIAHAGAPARPLHRGASGGELSRVMLAVEVVFAGADRVPTLVFDEVDAGVGGRAAVEVGRRLARLAATHQVIAVTHLPQVAAFAHRHLVVVKDDDGSVTASGVREVEGGERLRELARMLAGLDGSDTGLAHAEELLATAQRDKAVSVTPHAASQ